MSKNSKRQQTNGIEVRIPLTQREFSDFQGVCAIAALKVQTLQQQAAQQIAVAQQPRQQEFLRLAKKYRRAGMRPDQNYRFDEASHSLVLIPEPQAPK